MMLQFPIRDRRWRILLAISRMLSQRPAQLVFLGLALCLFLLAYLHIADEQSAANDNPSYVDQSAYMNFARKVYESRFQFTGTRSRMPLYPWIQALFYAPELTEEQFFEQGKKLNIIISVVCLAVLGIAFFVRFPRLYASYAMLVIAYLLFALKAPWLQAELL